MNEVEKSIVAIGTMIVNYSASTDVRRPCEPMYLNLNIINIYNLTATMRTRTHRSLKRVSPKTLLLQVLLLSLGTASAQAISDDSIVYTTLSGWNDMRACARCPFQVNFSICGAGDVLNDVLGCQTNACLCRPSTLGEAVEVIDEKVISLCSNYDDQSTATDFLLRYCSEHGYTSVETAAASPTGASLTAITTVTATVTEIVATQTIFRSSAEARVIWRPLSALATFAALLLPVVVVEPNLRHLIIIETETSSEETQKTTESSHNQPTFTSDSSSSHTTPATSAPITPGPSSTTSSTQNASPTDTAGSEKDSSDDDKLKTTDLVGIIVGILSLLIAVLTLWVSWKTGRPKKLWQGVTNQRRTSSMA
ncbi:hypothetical protein NPX13_g2065 [Xylaria arbuscula]|uniref:Extracellular membrane protein CFEM domain-containing protein n=1 Tax=Xylaria arbuscula TaxID=114810 RepID=A0A9W8TRD3_9PEZI|nr:hypothetical protein NPX13_g2065 [Xylaria arbuscula]